jgi:FkbM family methyltransferase
LELRNESPEQAETRSAATFDRLAWPFNDRVVIFGSGHLGRLVASGLRAAGQPALAFCDNNAAIWESSIDGVPVLSPATAVERYGHSAAFVVGVYNSIAPFQQLRELSCPRIVPYLAVFWKYWRFMTAEDRVALPQWILRHLDQIPAGYDPLADERSRQEFRAQIRWRVLLDYDCLLKPDATADIYYPADLIELLPDEVFVDCGAYDGDSIRAFLAKTGGRFRKICALEADPGNFARLEAYRRGLPADVAERMKLLPYAISAENGKLRFLANGCVESKVAAPGEGIEVECRTLDTVLAEEEPTFIKMDIEGAEPDALSGVREVAARCRPVIAACAYHGCDHLWIIPQLMKACNPDYQIFLRRYADECWEIVYYAVPPERIAARRR